MSNIYPKKISFKDVVYLNHLDKKNKKTFDCYIWSKDENCCHHKDYTFSIPPTPTCCISKMSALSSYIYLCNVFMCYENVQYFNTHIHPHILHKMLYFSLIYKKIAEVYIIYMR